MKDIKNLVNNYQPIAEKKEDMVIDDFAKNIIDRVFNNLATIFPAWKHNWKSDDPNDPDKVLRSAKREWTKAFVESEINTIEQIQTGFAKARKSNSDFLPSPGKFISWCKQSPEDMGWPSVNEALKQCIKHRNNQKFVVPQNIYIRPMIVKLCKRVDWWLMNNANNQADRKKADEHFFEKYMELLNSGYVEPQQTEHDRLPTQEVVKAGMSEQQKADKQKRDLEQIKNIKAKLKGKRT